MDVASSDDESSQEDNTPQPNRAATPMDVASSDVNSGTDDEDNQPLKLTKRHKPNAKRQ